MADPYKTLGVEREASQDVVRKAYLRLAKKSHPDLHPGDKGAEARFKEIGAAYDIIGDAVKRAKFDNGEIDVNGAERPPQPERRSYRHHAEAHPDFKYTQQFGDAGDGIDPFADLFRTHRSPSSRRGADINYTYSISFLEAANGAKKRVTMSDGKAVDITIPAGLRDGQTLRLHGQGYAGSHGAAPGDALVEIHVEPHPAFQRDGHTIKSTLRVTLGEALAGAKLQIETISGAVSLNIPKGSNNGAVLRLRGQGIATKAAGGDHLVTLHVVLPSHLDDDLVRAIAEWEVKHPFDPRKEQKVPS